jgi:hypothetical protein
MSMPPPRRNKPTTYKQPNRINAVSMVMFLMLTGCIYFVYCAWPVMALRLRVKGDLEDVMNRYWRANLNGGESLRQAMTELRHELSTKLAADGVKDKKLDFVFTGDKQRIAIEARFDAPVYFPGFDKTYVFHLAPKAETDAARVDW